MKKNLFDSKKLMDENEGMMMDQLIQLHPLMYAEYLATSSQYPTHVDNYYFEMLNGRLSHPLDSGTGLSHIQWLYICHCVCHLVTEQSNRIALICLAVDGWKKNGGGRPFSEKITLACVNDYIELFNQKALPFNIFIQVHDIWQWKTWCNRLNLNCKNKEPVVQTALDRELEK